MIIISWSNVGLIGVLTDDDVFKNVFSIFITYAILNFFQGTQLLYIYVFFCIYFCQNKVTNSCISMFYPFVYLLQPEGLGHDNSRKQ